MAADTPQLKSDAPIPNTDVPNSFGNRALAELDYKSSLNIVTTKEALPLAFGSGKDDLKIVDDRLAAKMKVAEGMLTPEQIDRVNRSAAIPHRYIQQAAEFKPQEQVTAQAGDSYWSVAQSVLQKREGKVPTNPEVNTMMRALAAHNGKTMEEAANLHVGDTIKIPPAKKSH